MLSLQETHDLMLGSGVPLDRYLVFCKLLRAGYIVQRHPARFQSRLFARILDHQRQVLIHRLGRGFAALAIGEHAAGEADSPIQGPL